MEYMLRAYSVGYFADAQYDVTNIMILLQLLNKQKKTVFPPFRRRKCSLLYLIISLLYNLIIYGKFPWKYRR